MDPRQFKDAVFGHFARVGSAFARPRRVEIIDLLARGERSVDSIAAQTQMGAANTSRHLQVFYALADDQVLDWYRGLVVLAESRLAEVSALAGAFFGEVDGAQPVSFAQLDELAASGEVIVVDVRPAEEYAAGHIDGAACVPLVDLSDKMRDLPADASVIATAVARTAYWPPRPSRSYVSRASSRTGWLPATRSGSRRVGRSPEPAGPTSSRTTTGGCHEHPVHPERPAVRNRGGLQRPAPGRQHAAHGRGPRPDRLPDRRRGQRG